MRDCALFSPGLHPVLARGTGHEDPMGSPQMPTRRAVGPAVLNNEAHRQIDHALGIMTARWSQIPEGGGTICATRRPVMLRRGEDQITRTPQVQMAQVVQRPMTRCVPIGRVTTARTRLSYVLATRRDDLGLGQVCGPRDPFARVEAVCTWTAHRMARLPHRLEPALDAQRLLEATRYLRDSLRFARAVQDGTLETLYADLRQASEPLLCTQTRKRQTSSQVLDAPMPAQEKETPRQLVQADQAA